MARLTLTSDLLLCPHFILGSSESTPARVGGLQSQVGNIEEGPDLGLVALETLGHLPPTPSFFSKPEHHPLPKGLGFAFRLGEKQWPGTRCPHPAWAPVPLRWPVQKVQAAGPESLVVWLSATLPTTAGATIHLPDRLDLGLWLWPLGGPVALRASLSPPHSTREGLSPGRAGLPSHWWASLSPGGVGGPVS